MTKVSIILAIYNVEKYIRQALDSAINQTLTDIEIICVDDCSTDNSPIIVREYAEKDSRIRFIQTERNSGPGVARNMALDIAQGEYIMFLDPDDWLDLSACEILYNQAVQNNNDIVMFNFTKYHEKSKKYVKRKDIEDFFSNILYKKAIKLTDLKQNFFTATYPWTKIYKRQLLKDNDIKFSNHRICEDDIFVIKTFLNSASMSIVDKNLYYYRIRKGSLMRTYNLYMDVIETKYLCYKYVKDFCVRNKNMQIMKYFMDYYANAQVYYLDEIIFKNLIFSRKYYYLVKEMFKSVYEQNKIFQIEYCKKLKIILKSSWGQYCIRKFIKNILYIGNSRDKSHKIVKILGIKIKINRNTTKKIIQNYNNDIKRIRSKLKNKEKINVLFLLTDNSKWKYQFLYEKFEESDIFYPVIAVTISDILFDYNLEKQYEILDFNYNFFKNKGMNVVYAWNKVDNSPIDLNSFNCDIVFYQQRYQLAQEQDINHVSEFALTCYVPYYLPDYIVPNLNYDNPFFSKLYRHYVLNKQMENYIKKECTKAKKYSKNIKGLGHTMLDYFYYNNRKYPAEYVIYAPHWSIYNSDNEDTQYISTFDKNGEFILEYAKQHPEIKWVFKPHPTLEKALERIGWSQQKIKEYYNEWEKIGIYCNDSSYIDLFFQSKCLITDCGSFLLEYFVTQKPLIHLVSSHNKNKPYEFNKRIFETFYNVHNEQELLDSLNLILLKAQDPKSEIRIKTLQEANLIDHSASESILNDLLQSIK